MPQTSGFRSAKETLVVSFATQARAFILSDRNIFYTPGGGGGTTAGSNARWAFLVFCWSLAPDFHSAKKYSPVFFVHLAFIPQNFHESWRRKSLAIG